MKASSGKTSTTRFKGVIDNPIVGGVVAVASHPITGLGLRALAWAMSASNPVSLGVVVGAQVICVGLDTAREYRSSRLKEREKLIDHYEKMIARLDKVLDKLEKDPKERQLIRDRFNKAQEKPEYEKQPRKGLEKGEWQYAAARVIEWGTALATDLVSVVASHGANLAVVIPKYFSTDIMPEILTAGNTSEYAGTYAKRKRSLEENKALRVELIKRANALNIPGYNKSTRQLGKHVEDLERNVCALEKLADAGETYSNAKFAIFRDNEESKPLTFKVESRGMALLKSLRGAVFGSEEDYKLVFYAMDKVKSWVLGAKPEPVAQHGVVISTGISVTKESATRQSQKPHFDPKGIFDTPKADAVAESSIPSRSRSNSLDGGKIKRMVNAAEVSSGVPEEPETPTKTRPRSKSL